MQERAIKKIRDLGPYIVDEKHAGPLDSSITAVVMDNVMDRDKRKIRVKMFNTMNIPLWVGSSTVAIFKIKVKKTAEPSVDEVEEPVVPESLNSTHLFVSFLNKKNKNGAVAGTV